MSLEVVILAAGQGTRMRSDLPKVLHPVAGKAMLAHVIETAAALKADGIHVVIGHGAEHIRQQLGDAPVNWVMQEQQLGTGHAVAQALPAIDENSKVLVLYGDVPLVRTDTLQRLLAEVNDRQMGLVSVQLNDPAGYGRILRNNNGQIQAIVEQKDASKEQLLIREVNTGIVAASARQLRNWLPKLSAANAQDEYYLTDIIAMAVADEVGVAAQHPADTWEVQGVNDRRQLSQIERYYQREQAQRVMLAGVSLADAERFDLRGELHTGRDVSIDINCVFEGVVKLGNNVRIGPHCVLRDVSVADNSEIRSYSMLEESSVGSQCVVGPYARLRPGTVLDAGAKVGNFVETKKSHIGAGSKVNHLSYIGDATIGREVNVGAGTITCNYDGVNKYATVIQDGAFIGSNTSLVAPVKVGQNATVAAGSAITGDIPDNQLGVARGRQRNIDGWKRPDKKSGGKSDA